MLTCRDVDELLDAFVDSALPPTQMLEVARHGATCAACESQIQSITALSHMVGKTLREDALGLDLSGVWAGVERRLDEAERRSPDASPPIERSPHLDPPVFSRGPALPAWGTAAVVAVAAAMYFQPATRLVASKPGKPTVVASAAAKPTTVASRARLNQSMIERLAGKDVQVRRVPKDGTTAIWVSYYPDGAR